MSREANSGKQANKHPSGASSSPNSGSSKRSGPTSWQASLREAGPYLGMGFQIGGTVALFLGAGYLVDHWLGSLPWATVAGGVLGMVAALLYIARVSKELSNRSERSSSSSERGERPPTSVDS